MFGFWIFAVSVAAMVVLNFIVDWPMDLPAVAYECKKETDQKRLAQFPIRVQKVKRLRRQITELNRALRREKRVAIEAYEMIDRALTVNAENVQTLKGWKEMYESAKDRAEVWQRMAAPMGLIGMVVGVVSGATLVLFLT